MNWLAGKRAPNVPRPSRWDTWLRLLAIPALLVLLAQGVSLASFSLTFRGLVRTLNTGGSITLSAPGGIVVDPSGNTFVADTGNSRIVEVNAQGTASVLTITGLSPALVSPTGIAIDGSGNFYVTDSDACNSRIVKITPAGAATEVNTASVNLSSPKGVALDQSGNIFIADTGNNRIVEVTAGGSAAALTITVSSGSATLSSPRGLAVNTAGKLYIADSSNNRIVTVAAGSTTGVVASILGGVTLSQPTDVTVDRIGNVVITDTGNSRIAEIDTSANGTVLFTDSQTLNGPAGIALDPTGTVYISDTNNSRVLIVDPPVNGALTSSNPIYSLNHSAVGFGHSQLGTSTPVTLDLPFTTGSVGLGGVKVLTSGAQNLDFISTSNTTCTISTGASTSCFVEITFLPTAPGLRTGAVVLLDSSQSPLLTIPLYAWGDAPVSALSPNLGAIVSTGGIITSNPYQVALDGARNIYVGDYIGSNVVKIPAGGGSASVVALGTPGSIALQNITGVAVDGAGNLFIGDHQNSRIVVVTPGGVVSVLTINGLSPALGFPTALNFDGVGNLFIADFTNGRVVEVSSLVVAGSTSSGKGTVLTTGSFSFTGSSLTGLTVDAAGNVYLAARTQNSSSIIKVTYAGVVSAVAIPNSVTPAVSNPQGVAADPMGNIYIVDTGNARLIRISNAGIASVFTLTGLTSPTTLGSLLFGVTADPSGNLYIPDWTNNRIVFVNVSNSALTFANTPVGSTSSDSPKTATVTNLGNQPLVFSANPGYTASFSQNSSDSSPCTSSTSLASGMFCDVSLLFTPQTSGGLTANVSVTNNTLNVASSTQQVTAGGTGIVTADSTSVALVPTPTSVALGGTVSFTATVTDTATGHTSTKPTGNVAFTDTVSGNTTSLSSGNSVALDSTGKAVLAGVALSTVGIHTITATYAGVNGSFLTSANTTTVTVTAQITPTITWAQPSAILVGTTLNDILNATATNNSAPVPGTFAYTATLQGGGPATVTSATVLATGSYTLNTTFTPADTTTYHSATASVSLTVQDFTLGVVSAAGASGTTSATVAHGGTATYVLSVGPASGTTFPAAVTLAASGLPPGATATLTPSTIPAGSGTTAVTLAIQTSTAIATATPPDLMLERALSPAAFAVLLLPFAGTLRRAFRQSQPSSRYQRFFGVVLLILNCAAALAGLSGCGSARSGYLAQRSQTYTVTITATSGTLLHATTVNLTVN